MLVPLDEAQNFAILVIGDPQELNELQGRETGNRLFENAQISLCRANVVLIPRFLPEAPRVRWLEVARICFQQCSSNAVDIIGACRSSARDRNLSNVGRQRTVFEEIWHEIAEFLHITGQMIPFRKLLEPRQTLLRKPRGDLGEQEGSAEVGESLAQSPEFTNVGHRVGDLGRGRIEALDTQKLPVVDGDGLVRDRLNLLQDGIPELVGEARNGRIEVAHHQSYARGKQGAGSGTSTARSMVTGSITYRCVQHSVAGRVIDSSCGTVDQRYPMSSERPSGKRVGLERAGEPPKQGRVRKETFITHNEIRSHDDLLRCNSTRPAARAASLRTARW